MKKDVERDKKEEEEEEEEEDKESLAGYMRSWLGNFVSSLMYHI